MFSYKSLCGPHMLTETLKEPSEQHPVVIPILQMIKLRLREVKFLAHNHKDSKS